MDLKPLPDIDFSQLWDTEKDTLASIAYNVPDNGVIVEIGTAQGGSAFIMDEVTKNRKVDIFSFDIATSIEAFDNLANTKVKLFTMSSVEGAKHWNDLCGKKIDMLLIDGSHAFQHVFEDIQNWIPLMRNNGIVMFHDYDSDERGGLIHFGTEVALKALLETQCLKNPVHTDRFLYGKVGNPIEFGYDLSLCLNTFKKIGNDIKRLLTDDFSSWNLVGDKNFAELIVTSVKCQILNISDAFKNITGEDKYLIFVRPLISSFAKITEYKIPTEDYKYINSLQACYLLEKGLTKNRDVFLNITPDRNKFFGIEEKLFMFNHAFGVSKFPEQLSCLSVKTSVELSIIIAKEQMKLGILMELFELLLGMKP